MILSQAATRIARRRRRGLRPQVAVRGVLGHRPRHRAAGAVRRARPGGHEPRQQGHVHSEQPRARHRDPCAGARRSASAIRSARSRPSRCSAASGSSRACTSRALRTRRGRCARSGRRIPHAQDRSRHRYRGGARRGIERGAAVVRHPRDGRAAQGSPTARGPARRGAGQGRRTLPRSATIAGLDFDAYVELTQRVSGSAAERGASGRTRRRRLVGDHLRRGCACPANGCDRRLARLAVRAVARCGPAAAKCWRCTHRATRQAYTGCGRKRWRSGTGSPSARRAANRSPPIAWYMRCAKRAFATRTPSTCRRTTRGPTKSSGRPTFPWSTAAKTSRIATPRTRPCW